MFDVAAEVVREDYGEATWDQLLDAAGVHTTTFPLLPVIAHAGHQGHRVLLVDDDTVTRSLARSCCVDWSDDGGGRRPRR